MSVQAAQRFNRRQTMLRSDYEAFHYCDDYLRDVALHHHDFYEIYLFLSGRVRYTVESRRYDLLPGDILLISPRELHQPVLDRYGQEPYSRIVIWVSAGFMRAMGAPYSCDLARCFDVDSPAHANLLRLDAAARGPLFELAGDIARQDGADPYGGLHSAVRLAELLIGLNRCRAGESERREQESSPPDTTQAVAGYINAHLAERLTLDRLADAHFVSKYHLAHRFRQAMGTSVYRYVTQKRLILARQLLGGSIPLSQIHRRCGFSTYSSFYRAFRAEYGLSPRGYRREAGERG